MIHITVHGDGFERPLHEDLNQFLREAAESAAREHYRDQMLRRFVRPIRPGGADGGPVTMVPVVSSDLANVGYHARKQELHIRFRSSMHVYVYSGVSAEVHRSLMDASSKGRYFHRHIKNRYSVHKQ